MANEAHVLNLDLDNDSDYCALAVLVKDFRFHITADGTELLAGTSAGPKELGLSDARGKIGDKFQNLVRALRMKQEHEEYLGDGRCEEEAGISANGSKLKRNKKRTQMQFKKPNRSRKPIAVSISRCQRHTLRTRNHLHHRRATRQNPDLEIDQTPRPNCEIGCSRPSRTSLAVSTPY